MVGPSDGIDVLIGGNSIPSFDDCFDRSVEIQMDGLKVRCLSPEDDARLPRLAIENFRHGEVG